MKKQDLKRYLRDYSIWDNRKTTINHAFCSALSVSDTYDESRIDEALKILGEDPEKDLTCIYCGKPAETWDHIMATVKNKEYSGYGHQIYNLLPCCKECNSKKGNQDWKTFLLKKRPSESSEPIISCRVERYLKLNYSNFESLKDIDINREIEKLNEIKQKVFLLLKQGDEQAAIIRTKLRKKMEEKT